MKVEWDSLFFSSEREKVKWEEAGGHVSIFLCSLQKPEFLHEAENEKNEKLHWAC